jgi:hypothetical protein
MVWECGNCSQEESRQHVVNAVCHHCGTPLCRECRGHRNVIFDGAFSGPLAHRRAVHCRSCLDEHYPLSIGMSGSEDG